MTIQSIPLSPIDYVFTGAGSQPITFVFCFPNQMDPQVLKKSLDETLDFFPILRSQLRKISEKDFEYFITEDELSIEVAESDLPFQESRKITEYITPVSRIKNDFVLKSLSGLESLRRQDGLAAMEKLHLRHPDSGMIVTNLTRMPVRDIDFGSGPPISFLAYADVFSSAAILQAEQGVEVLVANPLRVNL